jgi:hypothetical protein
MMGDDDASEIGRRIRKDAMRTGALIMGACYYDAGEE